MSEVSKLDVWADQLDQFGFVVGVSDQELATELRSLSAELKALRAVKSEPVGTFKRQHWLQVGAHPVACIQHFNGDKGRLFFYDDVSPPPGSDAYVDEITWTLLAPVELGHCAGSQMYNATQVLGVPDGWRPVPKEMVKAAADAWPYSYVDQLEERLGVGKQLSDVLIKTEAARHLGEDVVDQCGLTDIREFAHAIEAATRAEQNEHIQALERKSDQDDQTILWQAERIAQLLDQIEAPLSATKVNEMCEQLTMEPYQVRAVEAAHGIKE